MCASIRAQLIIIFNVWVVKTKSARIAIL